MKTEVRDTSIKAYRELDDLGPRQRQVLDLLMIRDMTNLEISKAIMRPINQVTPRTKELRDLGLVESKYHKICPYTGRLVTVWGLVSPERNLSLFHAQQQGFVRGQG